MRWRYQTSLFATAYFRITPKRNIHIAGFPQFRWRVGGTKGRGIVFTNVFGGSIKCTSRLGPGVTVTDSIDVSTDADVETGDFTPPLGYGVVAGGASRRCPVNVRGSNCRHVFTTIPTGDGVTELSAGPYGTRVTIDADGSVGGLAPIDTHAGAVDTVFLTPIGRGSGDANVPTLQDRGFNTQVVVPDLTGGARAITSIDNNSHGMRVSGGRCETAPSSSLGALALAGDKAVVDGTEIIAAVGIGVDNTGTDNRLHNVEIEALSCTRENAGADTGFVVENSTFHISAFYAHDIARGLYRNNRYVNNGGSTVYNAPTATARMEVGWHAPLTEAFATPFLPNPTFANCIAMLLTNNITITNPAAGSKVLGNRIRFIFTQDGTGTRTTTFGTDFKANWNPNLAANRVNSVDFEFNGTHWIQTASAINL